jgi:hypothetical protein
MDKGIRNNIIYVAIIFAVAVGLGLAGALFFASDGKLDNSGSRSIAESVNGSPAEPVDNPGLELPLVQLDGEWMAEANGSKLVGTVHDETIRIVMQNEGYEMAYWHGTFRTADSPGATILSTLVETPGELVMSSATEKNFVVQENTISFELTAMGMTTTVIMNRV